MNTYYIYISYFLSLASSFLLYIFFGTYMTVSSSFDSLPLISFIASLLHFGVGSWLVFWNFKIGKAIGLSLSFLMLLWPLLGMINSFELIIVLLPILISIIVLILMKYPEKIAQPNKVLSIILSIIPFSIFIYYLINFLVPFFIKN